MAFTKRSYTDMLLGLFVAGALALLVTFIFLLGQERRIFDTTETLSAQFPNVAGLRVGADVLLGGVAVGRVSDIQFPSISRKTPNAAEKECMKQQGLTLEDAPTRPPLITVVMRVSRSMMPQIREDSEIRIDSEGLLGDKNINITIGMGKGVRDGQLLCNSAPAMDFNQRLNQVQEQVGSAVESIGKTAMSANRILESFVAKGGDKAIAQIASSLGNVAREIERGDGIVHKLIYDKKAGDSFQQGLAGLEQTIASVRKTAAHIDAVLAEVEKGNGLLHALVYDPEGAKVVASAGGLLKEAEAIAKGIRTGSGILHTLIYEQDNGNVIRSMNAAAADLQKIVARIQNGEGTFGRLIADPTVYEDLKLILSDVKRNKVLKTLIRFGLSVNENPNE